MANTTVGLRLDTDTQARLKRLGNSRDRSPHYLMKQAVETYLKHEEEVEAEKVLLKARWEKFKLTGETVPHNDVKAWTKTLSNAQAS